MNVIKSVIKDAHTVTGNLLNAAGVLSTTLSTVAVDATSLLSQGIAATPATLKELALTPMLATAAYRSEMNGTELSDEEKIVWDSMPASASDTVRIATIAASRLVAQMLKEEA